MQPEKSAASDFRRCGNSHYGDQDRDAHQEDEERDNPEEELEQVEEQHMKGLYAFVKEPSRALQRSRLHEHREMLRVC